MFEHCRGNAQSQRSFTETVKYDRLYRIARAQHQPELDWALDSTTPLSHMCLWRAFDWATREQPEIDFDLNCESYIDLIPNFLID